jgi:hypothetical protein
MNPCPPSAHAHQNADASSCQQDEITSDPKLLDIIGVLRGAAMIDNEDDISKSDSDDGDEGSDEIQEITALEHFASTLQKAQREQKRRAEKDQKYRWVTRLEQRNSAAREVGSWQLKDSILLKPGCFQILMK